MELPTIDILFKTLSIIFTTQFFIFSRNNNYFANYIMCIAK